MNAALMILYWKLGPTTPDIVTEVEESTVARAGYRPSVTQQKQRSSVTSNEYRVSRGGEQR